MLFRQQANLVGGLAQIHRMSAKLGHIPRWVSVLLNPVVTDVVEIKRPAIAMSELPANLLPGAHKPRMKGLKFFH